MAFTSISVIDSLNCITISHLLLSLVVKRVQAEPSAIRIAQPEGQPTFHYLDTVEVAYETKSSRSWIDTWCEVDGVPREKSRTEVDGREASASIQLSFRNGTPCWFELRSKENYEYPEASTSPFNYIAIERNLELRMAPTLPVQPPPNLNLTTTSRDVEPAVPATNVPAPDMTKIHVGIGVGAALAGMIIGALISLICVRLLWRRQLRQKIKDNEMGMERRRRRRRREHGNGHQHGSGPTGASPSATECQSTHSYPGSEDSLPKTHDGEYVRPQEFSPIYPDESASCYYVGMSRQMAQTYATDFAMADQQVWTDHMQSRVPDEATALSPALARIVEIQEVPNTDMMMVGLAGADIRCTNCRAKSHVGCHVGSHGGRRYQ
ncbi:hypothetical protein GGR54DRAFT_485479 [Hypoxylon sp. NC1633]|nr:hypothetical protein GGR54DRAFT_485479 [Hypoxylon sp. NC1633]